MKARAEARFEAALARAGLSLDPQDRAAALEIFRFLERACERLKAAEGAADEPR